MQWYYSPSTGKVSQGKEASWNDRLGPYATREEAEQALEKAHKRNEQADAAEAAEDDWGEPASWEK